MQTVVNQGTLVTQRRHQYPRREQLPRSRRRRHARSQWQLAVRAAASSPTAPTTASPAPSPPAAPSPDHGRATLVANSDARNWAGQITGNVFFNRTRHRATITIYTPQTYTGGTLINAGTMTLRDSGTLAGTSAIDINFATLTLDNRRAADLADRIGTRRPSPCAAARLTFLGRAQTDTTETIGADLAGRRPERRRRADRRHRHQLGRAHGCLAHPARRFDRHRHPRPRRQRGRPERPDRQRRRG